MPVAAMAEPVVDHQKRFQAAVEVIQSLPKNGSYRPSSDVMLRFYGLYKQAVVGPCRVDRPSFWDPVGRYKWDAWSRLGDMSREVAMENYVEEMKKVAEEVIGSMPVNEKTASLLHYFEPLYLVIEDMPRPPPALLSLRDAVGDSDQTHSQSEEEEEEERGPDLVPPADQEVTEKPNVPASTLLNDSGLGEGLLLLSDAESEVFCDSVDSVDQLTTYKGELKPNGLHSHPLETLPESSYRLEAVAGVTQVGAGHGGEWGGEEQGPSRRRSGEAGRDGMQRSRERSIPLGDPRQQDQAPPAGGGAPWRGGGDGEKEGRAEQRHGDVHLQQHVAMTLRSLQQDMKSVMERLEVVERKAHCAVGGVCLRCNAASAVEQEDTWWLPAVSGRTLLLLLLWPLVAHSLVLLLGRRRRRWGEGRITSS